MKNELFNIENDISESQAKAFYFANSGKYNDKEYFYAVIKPHILKNYGQFIGHDLQVIKYSCHSCNGTGVFKKYYYYDYAFRWLIPQEECWNCNKGIYMEKKFTLERYVLNGKVYHIPKDFNPHLFYISIIEGKIIHDRIDPFKAFTSYLYLLSIYDFSRFTHQIIKIGKDKLIEKNQKLKHFIQNLIRATNKTTPQ